MPPDAGSAERFEAQRKRLMGLAYRMLGSVAEAEEAVQDAFLRWHETDRDAVRDAGAFLRRVVTRLCLDRLKSARVRRQAYVGPWLPEPVLDPEALGAAGDAERAADLSYALMLALERLSPLERAAFLLHDVFDAEFAEIAATIGRSEAACRQLAARARVHVRAARPRFSVTAEQGAAVLAAFVAAAGKGEWEALGRMLAEEAVLLSDGGGQRPAALNPILGRARIVRFLAGLARKGRIPQAVTEFAAINGMPGMVLRASDGELQTLALQMEGGRIAAIYFIRNPEKLRHLPHPA